MAERKGQQAGSLELFDFYGSSKQLGAQYGKQFASLLEGFYIQELTPNKERLTYARACVPHIKRHAPESFQFLSGVASGSGLSLDEATLLVLHEEIYHYRFNPSHCTGIVVPRQHSRSKVTYVGQNWDWQPQLFPWAGLVRLRRTNGLRTLTYHYPGLWSCCGLNSQGLGLMWTGGGYFPPVKPTAGVPTYILTAEILLKRTVDEAIAFLQSAPRAGAFMFLLADATGVGAVIEATPRVLRVKYCDSVDYRANLFHFQETIKDSAQVASTRKLHSFGRLSAIKRHISTHGSRFSLTSVKNVLEHKKVRVHVPHKSTTLDQLIAECERGTLLVKRGGARHDYEWVEYAV